MRAYARFARSFSSASVVAVIVVTVVTVVTCAVATRAQAGAVQALWVAPVSGEWTDPARWSTNPFFPNNGTPTEAEYTALIDVPGPDYTITLDDSVDVSAVILRSSAALLEQTAGTFGVSTFRVGDGGTGHYRMTGGASGATLNVNRLSVGAATTSGTGIGLFEVLGGSVNNAGTETFVGAGAGAGTLLVSGGGSRYTVAPASGTHYIGFGSLGSGLAHFRNSASVTLGGVNVGAAGGSGTMLVQSANVFVNGLTVGQSSSGPGGNGTVILSHGRLSVGSSIASVGGAEGSANVIVDGGTLTIQPGAGINGNFLVNSTGTFTVNGGTVALQRNARLAGGQFIVNNGSVDAQEFHVITPTASSTIKARLIIGGSGQVTANAVRLTSSAYVQTGGGVLLGGLVMSTAEGSTVHPDARLSGGAFDVGNLVIGNGTFTYAGGTFDAQLLSMTGGRFVTTPGRDKMVRLGDLQMSGASRLDLADNRMVLDDGAAPPIVSIRALVRSGYNGGAWDGPGVMSSVAQTTPNYGIGYVRPSPLFTTLLVAYTRYGDADVDGVVDLEDFNALAANFGTGDDWFEGDFNYDGRVNLLDFNRLAINFGLVAAGPDVTPGDWAALAAVVPEPAAAPFATFIAAAFMARRRRC